MNFPRIEITRVDAKVNVGIIMPDLHQYPIFTNTRNSALDAELLAKYLNEHLLGHFQEMKRAAYEAGYKDGRSKRKKRDHFCRDLDHNKDSL